MTQSPSEPPNDPNRRPEETPDTSSNRPLGFDEAIAVLIAFLSLGTVLFWGLTRGGADSIFDEALSSNEPVGQLEARSPAVFGEEDAGSGVAVVPGTRVPVTRREGDRLSARAELAERAAIRRERNFRTGAVGTAAGVAGAAATAGEAEALVEPAPPEIEQETVTVVVPSPEASAPAKDPIGFRDVPDNYWAKPYIDGLSSRGLISGFDSGDFRPDEQVTRAQIANIVSRTFTLTANKSDLAFSDVNSDYWARESIGEVVKGGFMTGFPNDTFRPEEPVTRAQSLTTLVTGLGIEPPNNVQPTLSRYKDANKIPEWATGKIAAATVGDLVVNYPNVDQINANQPTTRAELAALIYQALAKEGVVEPIDSQYAVEP